VERIPTKGLAWDLIPAWVPKVMIRLTPNELETIFRDDEYETRLFSTGRRYEVEEEEDLSERRKEKRIFPLS